MIILHTHIGHVIYDEDKKQYYDSIKGWNDVPTYYSEDYSKTLLHYLKGYASINTRMDVKDFLKILRDKDTVDIIGTVLLTNNNFITVSLKDKDILTIEANMNDDIENGILAFFDKNEKVLYVGATRANMAETMKI